MGGWGIKTSIIPAGKVCPHIKTMLKMMMMMMMILFKTIKVMSGAQNKVRIITSKKNILPSQLEKSRKIIM